jgi:hypothetical protein
MFNRFGLPLAKTVIEFILQNVVYAGIILTLPQ